MVGKDRKWKKQAEMAASLDISTSYLNNILKGNQGVSGELLKRLANQKVDMNWLITGSDVRGETEPDVKKEMLEAYWATLSEKDKSETLGFLKAHQLAKEEVKEEMEMRKQKRG